MIIDLENNYFFIKFVSHSDYLNILVNGLWIVLRHYLKIQPWYPSFKPATHTLTLVVAWVRFLGMPCELYHLEILRKIGNTIGCTIRLDYHIEKAVRGKFVRGCGI